MKIPLLIFVIAILCIPMAAATSMSIHSDPDTLLITNKATGKTYKIVEGSEVKCHVFGDTWIEGSMNNLSENEMNVGTYRVKFEAINSLIYDGSTEKMKKRRKVYGVSGLVMTLGSIISLFLIDDGPDVYTNIMLASLFLFAGSFSLLIALFNNKRRRFQLNKDKYQIGVIPGKK